MSRAARLANGSSSGLKSSALQVRSITPIICPAPSVTGVAAHAIEVRASAKCSVPVTTDGHLVQDRGRARTDHGALCTHDGMMW